jgi:hypothetical protein
MALGMVRSGCRGPEQDSSGGCGHQAFEVRIQFSRLTAPSRGTVPSILVPKYEAAYTDIERSLFSNPKSSAPKLLLPAAADHRDCDCRRPWRISCRAHATAPTRYSAVSRSAPLTPVREHPDMPQTSSPSLIFRHPNAYAALLVIVGE